MINPNTPVSEVKAGGAAGFTLIELMIVVVIVGILLMVALPGYQDSMQKGRRADAKSGLMDAANREERFMLDRNTYTVDMMALGLAGATTDTVKSEEGFYNIKVEACASDTIATCYVLTATPVPGGAQADDARCTTLVLDYTGAKTATGTTPTECW
jgi:type IV pilus assembly protein PilE